VNGRSSKSFIEEGRWDSVFYKLRKGDYVFIQFGHNDEKFKDSTRFTVAEKDYRQNLIRFVRETRAQGAIPILLTSICRRKFDEGGNLVDTHGNYPNEMKKVAQELKVPLVDMEQKSKQLVQSYGVEASKKIYLWIEPGEYNRLPEGKQDDTHFSEFGARIMAGLVVEGIRENNLELAKFLKK